MPLSEDLGPTFQLSSRVVVQGSMSWPSRELTVTTSMVAWALE